MTSSYLQVSPVELEELIQSMVGVSDAAVVGVPDVRSGQVPRAYVVRSSNDVTEDRIHAYVKGMSSSCLINVMMSWHGNALITANRTYAIHFCDVN